MHGRRSISITLSRTVELSDSSKNSKIEFQAAFSFADLAGIALFVAGLLANVIYRPYAQFDRPFDANYLVMAFLGGTALVFLLLLVFNRTFVHFSRKIYAGVAFASAILSLSNFIPLVIPLSDDGILLLSWLVTGVGNGGLVLVWGCRLAVFPMRRIGFHAMVASFAGSLLFFCVMFLSSVGADRVVIALFPFLSAGCFVKASLMFEDEFPPFVSMKRVYEKRTSFVKLVVFTGAYGIAYGICFAHLPGHSLTGSALAFALGGGYFIASAWLFANLFVFRRTIPTNAMILLCLLLLSAGVVFFFDSEPLLVLALILLVAFLLLHLDQCVRKTLKCTNAFEGRFFFLYSIECLANVVGMACGLGFWTALEAFGLLDEANKPLVFWGFVVILAFVTLVCSVDFEKKPETYTIPTQKRGSGQSYSDAVVVSSLIKSIAEDHGLSARQTEVLSMLAKGRNASVIERELVISSNTAKSHIYTVYQKLGVHSQQELLDFIDSYERKRM